MTEKLYPESVVKELLKQQKEMCATNVAVYGEIHNQIKSTLSPELKRGIETDKLLLDFFLWFRENGEDNIGKSIEEMINIYLTIGKEGAE